MKILHILNDGHSDLPDQTIDLQSKGNEIKVIDLQKKDVSYETLVDEIFLYDRVVSW